MSDAARILDSLAQQGVVLWGEGSRLRYRAAKGSFTEQMRSQLASNKAALLEYWRKVAASSIETHPATYGQRALWFLQQSLPASAAYNVVFTACVRSSIDTAALKNSCQALVDRHPSLRTTYNMQDDALTQQVHGFLPVHFQTHHRASVDSGQLREEIIRASRVPFDLERGPLVRVELFTRAPDDHVLLITVHHIAADGWSLFLLLDDLRQVYASECEEGKLPAPRPLHNVAEFARWQKQMLSQGEGKSHEEYWMRHLAGELAPLNLPTDRPRPASFTTRGATLGVDLGRELSKAIRELALCEGATPYVLLLAAYQVLLHRYTGQPEVIVGSPTYGRDQAEFSDVVGDFINMIPLRARISGDLNFREFLAQARQTVLEGIQHQDYPFPRLVEKLQPVRDPSRSPVFQTLFVLQKFKQLKGFEGFFTGSAGRLDWGGLVIEPFSITQQEGQFELSLELVEHDGVFRGDLKYNTDLYNAATVERLGRHYVTLLRSICASPDMKVSGLALMDRTELEQLVEDGRAAQRNYPRDVCLHQLIEAQAERTPESIAVAFEGSELTYGELNKRANQLANFLQKRGVQADTLVGICVERSLEIVVGLLGILKAGGAYVPMDPSYPECRLDFMLEDAGVEVLLTQQHLKHILPSHGAEVICLDADWGSIASESTDKPEQRAQAEHLAYVIYTSGSTGQPKGAMNAHVGIVNRLLWMQDEYQLTSADAVLQKTPFSFDVSVWEFFWPLLAGARLVIARPGGHQDPAYLIDMILREHVTVMHFVPSMLRMFLAADGLDRCTSLRQVIASGEALSAELVKAFHARLSANLDNLYGPTEAAVDVTYWPCPRQGDLSVVPIGRPVANTQCYILDPQLQPVPAGVPGELHLGGIQVGRGYHKRPELTAEKFISDPFRKENGARLYRTGDLCRRLADGTIEYLGRLDHQVKIRGFRIELGEVEAAIGKHGSVKEVVVVAREVSTGDQRLVAYLVPRDAGAPVPGEIREYLLKFLPDYMVPSTFVALEGLPLSPNGKIDRNALPKPDKALLRTGGERVAPRTLREAKLVEIWKDLLRLSEVGVEDNFFELGGHSLLAMQLLNRVRKTLGAQLDVRAVFEAPTVAEFAARLDGSEDSGAGLEARARPERLPLSYAQERFWFLDQLEGSRAKFKIRQAVRFRGDLNREALECAAHALFERHEGLRTRFAEKDGVPQQIVEAATPVVIEFQDLSENRGDLGERTINSVLLRQAEEPLRLGDGRLLRLWLIKLAQREHILHWCCHHIIFDGWSVEIFNRELSALYSAFCEGQPSPLPPLALQYADYALWQRDYLQGKTLEQLVDYWRDRLEGCPTLELPLDFPRPAFQTYAGAMASFVFSDALNRELRQLSKRENATIFMTLLAALKVLLFRYTGQEDIAVGIPIANRGRAGLETLIGCLLNTLVVRSRLLGADSFGDVLRRVRNELLGAYAHQELPFEKLLEELQPERSLNRTPLFQVFVNFMHLESVAPLFSGLEAQPLPSAQIEAKFDIEFYILDFEQRLRIDLVYNSDLFEAATIERMLERFEVLLEAIVADPEKEIGGLALLTAEDRREFTVQDNCVQPTNSFARFAPGDLEQSIPARFAKQVQKDPDRMAVETPAFRWTYEELDQRSNSIAQALLLRCSETEQRIALLMEHDAPMIAATLGVLKSGKAYVALDPAYPAARLAQMIEDSQVRTIIADETNSTLVKKLSHREIKIAQFAEIERAEAVGNISLPAADAIAYLLYTSGSTGEPKGITQDHRNVLHHIRCYTNSLHISAEDRLLMVASLGVDAAVQDIFAALLNGATLCPFDVRKNEMSTLADWMVNEEITIFHSTPSLYRHFVAALSGRRRAFPKLRLVVMGGEKVLSSDIELYKQHFEPGSIFVNGFGLSESTLALQGFFDASYENTGTSVPIGNPVEETEVLLLNAHGDAGQVRGEIAIRSRYLAQGYWRRPELTAAAFLPDHKTPGYRIYRTGDMGRLLPNGMIEFLGRRDFQIKIRGHRVECEEIEVALSRHPEITHSAIMVRQNARDEQELIAYVVPRRESSISSRQLRDFLGKVLPNYMIPQMVLVLESLPMTASGKIDRKALPVPEDVTSHRTQAYVAPVSPIEKTLAEIWIQLLRIEKVGVHDDFFESGGHSLLATRLASQIRRAFGVEIALRSMFESPTIAEMSELIQNIIWAAGASEPDLPPGQREEMLL